MMQISAEGTELGAPVSVDEFTLEQVMKELEKYPIVRDRNSVVVESNDPMVIENSEMKENEMECSQEIAQLVQRQGTNFWITLGQQLEEVTQNPIIGESILQSFKDVHKSFIQSLSLDDIERLAVALSK